MADIKKIGDELVGLTVKEVKELADYLKDEYGIEPAAAALQLLLDLLLTVEKLLKNKQNLMLFLHQAVLLN